MRKENPCNNQAHNCNGTVCSYYPCGDKASIYSMRDGREVRRCSLHKPADYTFVAACKKARCSHQVHNIRAINTEGSSGKTDGGA